MKPGILALDIDGTLTADASSIPEEVATYLASLTPMGWQVCVITGRSFDFARSTLERCRFPYYLAVHNGAILVEMPGGRILKKNYLSASLLADLEAICLAEGTDFIIYTGMENEDLCYYRPHRFEKRLITLLERRAAVYQERWLPVENFVSLSVTGFPAVKCFGNIEEMHRIAHNMQQKLSMHVPVIRDPFCEELFIALATTKEASKGQVVSHLREYFQSQGPLIAAGDDYNDLPMLENADIKIVMDTAPTQLKNIADIVAPSAEQFGIIDALREVIEK